MIIGLIVANNASLPLKFVKSLMTVKEYDVITQEGPSIPFNRNEVFERARLENQDLLFIDSDMVFTKEDVKKMEEHLKTKDVVSGVAIMSFTGNPPAIFKKKNNGYFPVEEFGENTFEVDASGAAFLGISKKVINTLTEPFTPIFEPKYGQYYGEDTSFCIKAKEAGFKVWCDPSLSIGHIKTQVKYYGKA